VNHRGEVAAGDAGTRQAYLPAHEKRFSAPIGTPLAHRCGMGCFVRHHGLTIRPAHRRTSMRYGAMAVPAWDERIGRGP
jgi:hypothetical protein